MCLVLCVCLSVCVCGCMCLGVCDLDVVQLNAIFCKW
jgi:hypothetical protein